MGEVLAGAIAGGTRGGRDQRSAAERLLARLAGRRDLSVPGEAAIAGPSASFAAVTAPSAISAALN